MAKLRGAKKAAFLQRMASGRRKAKRGTARVGVRRRRRRNPGALLAGLSSVNPRRRRATRRMRFRRNPLAVIANPGFSWFGPSKPRRKRRVKAMAKRRRKRRSSGRRVRARRAAPRRRRRVHRRRPSVRRRRIGARARSRRVRRLQRGVIYVNPRRRRGRRSRHRRNPGMGGTLKRAFIPYATGFITSAAIAVLDTGLSNYPVVKNIVKVGAALSIAAFGRRYPVASTAAIAAIAACQGYPLGTRLAGGMVAQNPAQAVKGLAGMAAVYPEMGALLNGGMGALLNGPENLDQTVIDYQQAVANMADDD